MSKESSEQQTIDGLERVGAAEEEIPSMLQRAARRPSRLRGRRTTPSLMYLTSLCAIAFGFFNAKFKVCSGTHVSKSLFQRNEKMFAGNSIGFLGANIHRRGDGECQQFSEKKRIRSALISQ